MSINRTRAKQIIQEELRRALRARNLKENYMDEMSHGSMLDDDIYEIDLNPDDIDMHETYMEDDGMAMDEEYDMEEGQHDNDQGGQHDNDLGAGDDALMETVRRRLAAARRRR